MKVVIQLFATLAAYLPPATSGDSIAIDLPPGSVLADAIERLRIPSDLDYLKVVNGRDATADQVLNDGDTVSLFPPLAGGG